MSLHRGIVLALACLWPIAVAEPAKAWFWDEPPEPTPPPIHVYDYTRGPTWTSNGWAYVPVEVHFPRSRPPVLAMPPPPPPPPIAYRRPPRSLGPYPDMMDQLPPLPPLRKRLK